MAFSQYLGLATVSARREGAASLEPSQMKFRAIVSTAIFSLTTQLAQLPVHAAPPQAETPRSANVQKSQSGLDLSSLDTSVSPAKDFYFYANGGWLKSHTIPSDKPRWGQFNILADNNQDILKSILEDCSKSASDTPQNDGDKLGLLYTQGLDTKTLEGQNTTALSEDMANISKITNLAEVEAQVIRMHRRGISSLFSFSSSQDAKNSRKIIGELRQGGLALPEREYYFRKDEKSEKQRAAYKTHLRQAFEKLGNSPEVSQTKADQVFALETKLAEASLTNVQLRDPKATYNPLARNQLVSTPQVWDWERYLSGVGVSAKAKEFNLATPKFFQALSKTLKDADLDQLKAYLEWNMIRTSAEHLSDEWADFRFDFYGKTLTGTPAQLPRWRRVIKTVDGALGEALGKKYVEKTFPPAAKQRVQEMVDLISEAMREDLKTLAWMSPATRKKAQEKLSSFHAKIGYPDKFRDYSTLKLKNDSYLQNIWRCGEHEVQRDLAKIGTAPNPNDWYMTPPTVNAYYDPQMNEIVFPAGIMQSPFFSLDSDDALNYGGLGAVIGHEITHGFDDQGCQYDGRGDLKNWWTALDLKNFNVLAGKVEKQFSGYTVGEGLHINGKLVLGESIADLGGLRLSYLAYQKLLKKRPSKSLDGFTPEQRFFLGYARIWAINMRPEYERLQVNTDPHPHAHYRVNGPLSNMPEFAKAFNLPADCPMVRKDRILLW
jgi:putative endopeptidase